MPREHPSANWAQSVGHTAKTRHQKRPVETGGRNGASIAKSRTRRPAHIYETTRYRADFERPSYLTRWRRTGWLGRQDSNLRMAESKSSDKAKGRKDRNVRVKERPCNPSRQTTAAPGSSRRAPQPRAQRSQRRKPPRIERRSHLRAVSCPHIPSGRRPGSCASSPPAQARFPPASRWCRDRRRSSIRRCWLCAEHHQPPSCWASG